MLVTPCLPLGAFGAEEGMPSTVDGKPLSNITHVVGFMIPFILGPPSMCDPNRV